MAGALQANSRRRENGQSLILFVFFMMALILFVGLGIDLGFAYVTKAKLSKAVDAACLAGMRSFPSGTITASGVASSMFEANYGRPGRDVASVTPQIVWDKDASKNTILDVNATATINTFFIRVLPTWKTLSVKANAESARMNVIMSLVLDWSGSMFTTPANGGSGGALNGNLTKAVDAFIDNFDDDTDRAAMATFGSFAQLNVPMQYQFKTLIKNAENNLKSLGRTFGDGGLTIGLQQIQSVPLNPNEKVLRVIVFFTDGFANTFQDNFSGCGLRNLGQSDPFNNANGPWDFSFMNSNDGSGNGCAATTFNSVGGNLGGTIYNSGTVAINNNTQNIWREGQLRALATANAARNTNIVIYSIGLGTDPTKINQTFLKQIANVNDPSNPTFNSNQPAGEAAFAPTADDLEVVFREIAAKILLRLTK